MSVQIENISKQILLKLYECSYRHSGMTWSFQSARACERSDSVEVQQSVFDAMGAKGWIEADGGFAPYDLRLGVNGPDLTGDTAVRLTDRGVNAALTILDWQRPKSLQEKLHEIPRGDRIALVALIVSLVALLK